MHTSWLTGSRLPENAMKDFGTLHEDAFDGYVLKGVLQGLSYPRKPYHPSVVVRFAKEYSSFLKAAKPFIAANVLAMCESSKNPHHPKNVCYGESIILDTNCSIEDSIDSLAAAQENNKRACMFDQDYFQLPLVSDSQEDLVRWDRAKDLLATAILLAALPSRVPTIADQPAEVILEARERLNSTLPAFRQALLKGAWEVAKATRSSDRDEVMAAAKLYYETQIEPVLRDIEGDLNTENARLRRSLLEKGVDKTVLVAKAIDPTEPYSKWELLGSGLKSLLDIDESTAKKEQIRSPYEFLIRLPHVFRADVE